MLGKVYYNGVYIDLMYLFNKGENKGNVLGEGDGEEGCEVEVKG